MKNYSPQEKAVALDGLAKPLLHFLRSDDLPNLYLGIMRKHQMNVRQADALSTILNVTLLGLEPESTLETNFHQALPELSSATLRELIIDINDRVFKEARRRLQENIVTEEAWDEEELGPKPNEGEEVPKLLSDEELHRLAEEQVRTGWKPPEEIYIPPEEPVLSPIQPEQPASAVVAPGSSAAVSPQPIATSSIALQKLSSSSVVKTEESVVPPPTESPKEVIPAEPAKNLKQEAPQPPRKYHGGTDPYREPVE